MRPRTALAPLTTLLALSLGAATATATPPEGFETQTIVDGLNGPTAFAHAPDGRIFIAEQWGLVKVWEDGQTTDFIDLRPEVNDFGERGLLGLALDPDFASNGWVYLGYVEEGDPSQPNQLTPATNTVVRVQVSGSNPAVADESTLETILSDLPQPGPWHAIGQLAFDESGSLLVGLGDGSCYALGPVLADPCTFDVLNPELPAGKVLRVDPYTGAGDPRNPYYQAGAPASMRSRMLARGLRNPFRFSIDPPTGEIWIGDVGNGAFEEINRIPSAWSNADVELNFGWPCYEGGDGVSVKQQSFSANAATSGFCNTVYSAAEGGTGIGAAPPVYAWPHDGSGQAVVAGPVYRANTYPSEYGGRLFFANWVTDQFFTRTAEGVVEPFGSAGGYGNPVAVQLAPSGNIAFAAFAAGEITEIVDLFPDPPPPDDGGPAPAPAPPVPPPSAQPAPTPGPPPAAASQGPTATQSDPSAVCLPVPERIPSGNGTIRLTRQALVVQQRIDAAALRRLNAVNAWIDAGIEARDLCGGAFGPGAFQTGIQWAGAAAGPIDAPIPRALEIAGQGAPTGRFTLSRRQVRINDRISRALLARATATAERVESLTGGNLAPETRLDGRVRTQAFSGGLPPSAEQPASPLSIGPLPRTGTVRLTAGQLRTTQRRSQQAVRIANGVVDRLRMGLTDEQFQSGSIGSGRLG